MVVDDARKLPELWNEDWREWFLDGQDDPALVLIKVQGEHGEYWDKRGVSGIKYLIEAGKAYLTVTKPRQVESDPAVHGKVVV